MGVPPREFAGAPVCEPRWDRADRMILTSYLRMQDEACPHCGRPIAMHADDVDKPGDYDSALIVCHATTALDSAQARWAKGAKKAEDAATKRGRNMRRAQLWFTWRARGDNPEQPPDFAREEAP